MYSRSINGVFKLGKVNARDRLKRMFYGFKSVWVEDEEVSRRCVFKTLQSAPLGYSQELRL